jgi:hypothetical protein
VKEKRDLVTHLRQIHLRHAGVARDGVALEVQRHPNLVVGGDGRALGPVQLGHRLDGHGVGQAVGGVGFGERGVLPRCGHRRSDLVFGGVGRPGVAEPLVADHADANPPRLGEGHALHLATESAHLGPALLLRIGLDLLALGRGIERRVHELGELRHPCPRP